MTRNNCINANGSGVLQVAQVSTSGYTGYTEYFPLVIAGNILSNDSIPQQTDGKEILTLDFTPLLATSKIHIECHAAPIFNSGIALFKDATANALCMQYKFNAYFQNFELIYEESAASTATRTYKIRIGWVATASGGTGHINGNAAARQFGGAQSCRMTIYEILA